MIYKIKGRISRKKEMSVLVDSGDITYEILIPPTVMSMLNDDDDDPIEFITYYYFQTDQSKSIPILIGFLNEVEKEFFEKFITVSGIGPKAACKAMTMPFSAIADGIDAGDVALLKRLPGIGERKAREIIAKLQGKIGKFGLIQDRHLTRTTFVKEDIKEEALSVLLQLQYKRRDAEEMIAKAVQRNPNVKSSEELLNEVYRQRSDKITQLTR